MPNYQRKARQIARHYGIDPNVFVRQIQQESGFNPHARSPAGAQGIAQFIPSTARAYGVDVNDPVSSLDGAARYLRDNLKKYGSYRKALSVYNSGSPNGYKTIAETRNYVRTILGGRNPSYTGGSSDSTSSPTSIPGGTVQGQPSSTLAALPNDFSLPELQNTAGAAPPPVHPAFDPRPAALQNLQLPDFSNTTLSAIKDKLAGVPTSDATPPQQESPDVTVPALNVPGMPTRRSTKHVQGHGGYEGTEGIASDLGHVSGLAFGSQKRPKKLTVDGNVSDHYAGNPNTYAIDLTSRNNNTAALAAGAHRVARALGIRNYRPNRIYNVTKNGYRIQLIFGAAVGHGDHVHVGVKKL